MDFNDMHQQEGPEAVKACIDAAALPGEQAPAADPEQWPEPAPLVNQQESEPYPLDALPGIIGAAVCEVVDFVQCPVALAACSALAVVSQ